MVTVLDDRHRGLYAGSGDYGTQRRERAERIPCPFDKEHGGTDPRPVGVPEALRSPRRMKRITEKHDSVDGRTRSGNLRSNSATHRLAANNEPRGLVLRLKGANDPPVSVLEDVLTIGSLLLQFGIGKVEAAHQEVFASELTSELRHELVGQVAAGTMGENQERFGALFSIECN